MNQNRDFENIIGFAIYMAFACIVFIAVVQAIANHFSK